MKGKKGCFRAGTKISTPLGYKAIEFIGIGDVVYAFDKKGNISEGQVTETFKHSTKDTGDKILEVMHEKGMLYPTDNHYILCKDGETFKEVQRLYLGDKITLEDGSLSEVTGLIDGEDVDYTYNFSVEPQHTYIADGVRVHNKGGSKGGGGTARVPVEAANSLQSVAFVRIVDMVSEGVVEGFVNSGNPGTDIYFDDTPLLSGGAWNYSDIVSISRAGSETQDPLTSKFGSAGSVVDVSTQLSILGGALTRTITDEDVDAVRILITVPALLSQDAATGDINSTTVVFTISVQPSGGAYSAPKTVTVSGKCTAAYQRSVLIPDLSTYGSAPYNIKLTRTTADSATATMNNDTYWTNYTELIYEKLYYPNSALVAIEARADQFNNVPQRKYHIKGIKVEVPSNYDGTLRTYDIGAWNGLFKASKEWTNNPVWCLYDILRNSRYGYGLTEAQIDLGSFYSAAQYCDVAVDDGDSGTEFRFSFNTQIASYSESFYVANMIASTFRGMLYWSTGKVFLGQDRPADPIQNVDNASVVDGAFNYISSSRKDRHTQVAVTWNDPDDLYKQAIEFVDDRVGINRYGIRRIDTVAFGCTTRAQATRWGRWLLDTELNQTETVTYVAGLDHAGVLPGDVVSVSDEFYTSSRWGGRVVSATNVTNAVVTIDSPVTLVFGHTYELQVTLSDMTLEKLDVTTGAGVTSALTVDGTFTSAPGVESVWQLLDTSIDERLFRVISKIETDPAQYQITAVIYDPDKYARVELGIAYDAPIYTTLPDSNVLIAPTDIEAEEYQSTEGQNRVFSVLLSWSHSTDPRKIGYQVEWRQDPLVYVDAGQTVDNSMVFSNLLAATYDFRVRTLGLTGKSPWNTLDDFVVYADTTAAIDITGLQVVGGGTTFNGKHCEFEWDEVTYGDEADFKDYKVEIMTPADVHLRWMYLKENTAIYTYQMNQEDNSGTAIRSIKVRVWVRDIYDSFSINAAVATFSNPIPDMSSTLPVVTAKYGSLRVNWANTADNDMSYYKVYGDTVNPPTTELATLTYPINQYEFTGVDVGTVYYVQIEPYDLFGVGTKSQIPVGATPVEIPAINILEELSQSITATDSDANSAATLSKLYDRNYSADGVAYTVSGTDKYIEYEYGLSNYFDRVAVWTADANASVYCSVIDVDSNETFYKDAGDDINLEEATNLGDAQSNLWDLDIASFGSVRRNLRIMPNNIIGLKFRIYIRGTYTTTFYEFIPSRILISELAAIESLSSVSANIGTIITGVIQSEDYPTSGLEIDIDAGTITGVVTFLAGTTGIADTDAGDLATQDRVDLLYTDGADVTGDNEAATIASQGDLATVNTADFSTQVTGAEKPDNYAGITDSNMIKDPTFLTGLAGGTYWAKTYATFVSTGGEGNEINALFTANGSYIYISPQAASKKIPCRAGDKFYVQARIFQHTDLNGTAGLFVQANVYDKDAGSPVEYRGTGTLSATEGSWVTVNTTFTITHADAVSMSIGLYLHVSNTAGTARCNYLYISRSNPAADVTGDNEAATIASQGALATLDTVSGTEIDALAVSAAKLDTTVIVGGVIKTGLVTAYTIGANEIITNLANIGTAKVNTLHLVDNTVSNDVVYYNTSDTSINAWTYGTWYSIFTQDYITDASNTEFAVIFTGQVTASTTDSLDSSYINYSTGIEYRWLVINQSTTTTINTFTDGIGQKHTVRQISAVFYFQEDSGGNFSQAITSGWTAGQTLRVELAARRIKSSSGTDSATGVINSKFAHITGLKK